MLSLLEWYDSVALVGHEVQEKEWPEITDWNIDEGKFTLSRTAFISIPAGWDQTRMRTFLLSRPEASIYNSVAHSPFMAQGDTADDIDELVKLQRIVIEGKPYIDMFGLYVYITSRASWDKTRDVDLRFNANHYPYHHLPTEVEMILNADYDLLNRTSP